MPPRLRGALGLALMMAQTHALVRPSRLGPTQTPQQCSLTTALCPPALGLMQVAQLTSRCFQQKCFAGQNPKQCVVGLDLVLILALVLSLWLVVALALAPTPLMLGHHLRMIVKLGLAFVHAQTMDPTPTILSLRLELD